MEVYNIFISAESEPISSAKAKHRRSSVGAPVSVRARKAQNVTAHVGEATIVSAYGDIVADNAADVPMMELSELPVAVYPNDELLRIAQEQDWRIMKGSQ